MAVTEARVSPEMASHQIINGHRNEEDYAKTVFGGKQHKGKFYFILFYLNLSSFLQPVMVIVSNISHEFKAETI